MTSAEAIKETRASSTARGTKTSPWVPSRGPTESGQDVRERIQRMTGLRIKSDSPLTPWLARHAGWVYTRFATQGDGRTPYKLLFGRFYGGKIAEIGETVMAEIPEKTVSVSVPLVDLLA